MPDSDNNERLENHFEFFKTRIEGYKKEGLRIMASSSFQWHSIPMLRMISEIDPEIPVYFLQTGFHFPETLHYKDEIAGLYGLNVREVYSPIPKAQQRNSAGKFQFTSDPDYCCFLNKTLPMEPVTAAFDVWITGVRRDQNENRRAMDYEARGKNGILRFHPMLDWTQEDIDNYIEKYNIPEHPLNSSGLFSIGCEPCTQKPGGMDVLAGRDGRWSGMKKTECGLHTELTEVNK